MALLERTETARLPRLVLFFLPSPPTMFSPQSSRIFFEAKIPLRVTTRILKGAFVFFLMLNLVSCRLSFFKFHSSLPISLQIQHFFFSGFFMPTDNGSLLELATNPTQNLAFVPPTVAVVQTNVFRLRGKLPPWASCGFQGLYNHAAVLGCIPVTTLREQEGRCHRCLIFN